MKEKENKKLNRTSNLGETVQEYPETVEVLLDWGLHCVGCMAAVFDTIEEGAKVHGLTDSEIDELIERLNEVVAFKE